METKRFGGQRLLLIIILIIIPVLRYGNGTQLRREHLSAASGTTIAAGNCGGCNCGYTVADTLRRRDMLQTLQTVALPRNCNCAQQLLARLSTSCNAQLLLNKGT